MHDAPWMSVETVVSQMLVRDGGHNTTVLRLASKERSSLKEVTSLAAPDIHDSHGFLFGLREQKRAGQLVFPQS